MSGKGTQSSDAGSIEHVFLVPLRRKCLIRVGADTEGSETEDSINLTARALSRNEDWWVREEQRSSRGSGKGTQSCVASSIEHVFLVPLRGKCLIRVGVNTEGSETEDSINLTVRVLSCSEDWWVREEHGSSDAFYLKYSCISRDRILHA